MGCGGHFGALFETINTADKPAANMMSKRLVTSAAGPLRLSTTRTRKRRSRLCGSGFGRARSEPMRRFNAFLSEGRVKAEALSIGLGKTNVNVDDVRAAHIGAKFRSSTTRRSKSTARRHSKLERLWRRKDTLRKPSRRRCGRKVRADRAEKVRARYCAHAQGFHASAGRRWQKSGELGEPVPHPQSATL